ncbi:YfjL-like protein [Neobacillus ginsengisoli]|uniref:YfjL-like protein n=1 Tax=Neobacillus ginsengisoli TaxID=904295 RepID=UPI003F958DCD
MKATKVILWLLAVLILFICFYVYASLFGTPWEKAAQEANIQSYLTKKYRTDFVIMKTKYNHLSETYQSYAFPKENPDLLFSVEQDQDAYAGYSDTYPKVLWESDGSSKMKAKIKQIFPNLDVPTFKALRIVERGEFYGPNIPTYEEVHASQLGCSLTINMKANWEKMNMKVEKQKIHDLSSYLKEEHFPILVEIRYFEKEMHLNEKVYFLTEDGKIVEK